MSAKKKRNTLNLCVRCNCYFLGRDFEKHPEDCILDKAGTSRIRSEFEFVGTSCQVEKRETHLPSDAIGWAKYQTVLLNPDSLELLGILPRTPCLMNSDQIGSSLVIVWPCAEVSPLKICVQGLASERTVRLDVIKECAELKSLQLYPQDEIDDRLLSAEHFVNYVKVYLSAAFVSPDSQLTIKYLAKSFNFGVYEDDLDRLKRMNINKTLPIVYSLEHNFNLSFVENFR